MNMLKNVHCEHNVKNFSIKEFDIFENSPNQTFTRKFKDNKCYSFTSEVFKEVLDKYNF